MHNHKRTQPIANALNCLQMHTHLCKRMYTREKTHTRSNTYTYVHEQTFALARARACMHSCKRTQAHVLLWYLLNRPIFEN